ncbi:(d)CMP kinase [Candidatus Synchoanobacter obligatus]|uniref:Cytidylate kinase n=1 Tax=Candidatus Synchoanobacter obligatus TaxID=2919597 RepID=A0ABT1L750_9GAMM|nr:(d)CMP kinase [Candidatus Synchoanobacter obligatus]MCP8352593.1 (d)CMP kinase [Candidatus Synchoanobacter obligatus]
MLVAVDGQSSTGKSSLAGALACRLGFNFLGTGSLYRLVAYQRLNSSKSFENIVTGLVEAVSFEYHQGDMKVLFGGKDVTAILNATDVTKMASDIAKDKEVRDLLEPVQHDFYVNPGLVAEGRDMGTVIFPNADLKFFLAADVQIRAKRRHQQLLAMGMMRTEEELVEQLRARDFQDENRDVSPLVPATDAIMIDAALPWGENLDQMYHKVVEMLPRGVLPKELEVDFKLTKERAYQLRQQHELTGNSKILEWWRMQVLDIEKKYGEDPLPGMRWLMPAYQRGFNVYADSRSEEMNDFMSPDFQIVDQHFYNQLIRIPQKHPVTAKRVFQIALNVGQGLANKTVRIDYNIDDFLYMES